jgi:predicted nucleic acid-binding Zn ribbon protein
MLPVTVSNLPDYSPKSMLKGRCGAHKNVMQHFNSNAVTTETATTKRQRTEQNTNASQN